MTATATLKRTWAHDLETTSLYELLKLRQDVFVIEQKAFYQDLDDVDLLAETRHLWLADEGGMIAYLRLAEEHDDGVKSFRIARVCTVASQRGRGHTTRLLRAALAEVGSAECRIHAQSYLLDMYAKHGFKLVGAEFEEAGIPHISMVRAVGKPWTP